MIQNSPRPDRSSRSFEVRYPSTSGSERIRYFPREWLFSNEPSFAMPCRIDCCDRNFLLSLYLINGHFETKLFHNPKTLSASKDTAGYELDTIDTKTAAS